ncbi:hypothetical protein NQ317_002292 [Molorchus minor]|uniref:Transmembrane protein 70 n=1 Tax=Molorchus minor TaxID=1323400 RepID=A0ABQ9J577_9CUCU|nr:hypothetical protein NQ317_002292 [Molorchus minor]
MSLNTCRMFSQVKQLFRHNNLFYPVLLQLTKVEVTPTRLIFNIDNRLASTSVNSKDSENNIKQIYYGVLTPQIRAVKMFSLSSSLVGIISQPFLYKEIAATGNIPVIVAAYSFIGFFTVVTPVLLHFITKKYITHLEYNTASDSYIARTVNFFCLTKETKFKTEDVGSTRCTRMFTTFFAKGKALFLDPRMFENPEHYAKIMGYDKPINFKLSEKPSPDTRSSQD